jgi:tripartite-type tricarboxylate transporter receptor subunit TctC/nitrite reductase/ring-hydroxylating ferredoxin subunit
MPDQVSVAESEARRHRIPQKTWSRRPETREVAVRTLQIAGLAIVGSLAAASGLLGTPSQAEPWPHRTVRLIVPIGPGTALDFTARLFAERLSARWGQPVIIENRPGGDTIVGVSGFARAKDDHTLLFSISSPAAVLPETHETLPYDPAHDLVPISIVSDIFIAIAATPSLNVGSLADLVRLARSQPGTLNWAAGPGLPQYVFAAFEKSASLGMTLVPYRDVVPSLEDLGEGRIQVVTHSLSALLPVAQAGKARFLAVANRQRAEIVRDVPTAVEAGYPELAMDGFCGLFGWADMPTELREKIAADVRDVAADPVIAKRLATAGQVAHGSTPNEFATALAQQRARMATIVRAVGALQ